MRCVVRFGVSPRRVPDVFQEDRNFSPGLLVRVGAFFLTLRRMGDLSFWGFDEGEDSQSATNAYPPKSPLNLLKGSITNDVTRTPLRIRADFVTCTQ